MTMKDFIECAVDLRCTVLTKDNQFLFVGRITHYDPETDMIRLVDYERRLIPRNSAPEGSTVKLFIKLTQNKGELILIEGKVVKSMSLFLMIQAVQAVIKEEARDNYRQNIMRPAALSKVNEEPREVPCTILNVSATGIALQSPGLFQIGDILELTRQRFRVRGPEHTVKCKVVRMRGLTEGGYFYGCQFVELTQEEENRLYQDMFALQAAEMYKQRNPKF
ncbi:PilZ domain-containing protein [Hydrogenoanaerobacterium saccharovorans]|uniref:PilZ domain-containing protein n=1 Tax=Hydrogenoanaerobacterium saccharovorans TaxID=474960 RepID=A0ABS2GL44_9FIRM|nr:PilZ domain-containing protein [Hydrogenoanaerobacterium saccharovorans]MBM6923117.1 PilZ domain-containing protein [Hydrogenoanaerobacterium saccharovorans]